MNRTSACVRAVYLAAAVLLVACGDPHDKILPKDLSNWKEDLRSELKELTPEERDTLAALAKRYNSGTAGKLADGTSIRQALLQQREYAAEEARKEAAAQAAKDKLAREKENWRRLFEDALTVTYVGKKLDQTGFGGDFLAVEVAIKNNSRKTIAQFKGRIEFFNDAGGEITHEDLEHKQPVAPGKSFAQTVRMYRMPEGIYKDPATGNDKMRYHYKPLLVVFSDGEKLQLPKEFE